MDNVNGVDADNRVEAVIRADTVRPYDEGIIIWADADNRAEVANRMDNVRPYDRGIVIRADADNRAPNEEV